MRWITNTYNPRLDDAIMHIVVPDGETRTRAWKEHLKWLDGKFIGEPKETKNFTVEQLKNMNIVGVYVP